MFSAPPAKMVLVQDSRPSGLRLIQKLLEAREEFPDLGVSSEIQHAVADRAISERDKLRQLGAVEFLYSLSYIVIQHKIEECLLFLGKRTLNAGARSIGPRLASDWWQRKADVCEHVE